MAFPNHPYLDDCTYVVSNIANSRTLAQDMLQQIVSKIGSDDGINPVTTALRRLIFEQAARGDNEKFDIIGRTIKYCENTKGERRVVRKARHLADQKAQMSR